MSFQNYYVNIPAAANNPSNDQPLMETNTNSASQLWLQDHYGFKDNLGGQHKQVTFSKGSVGDNVPGAQSGANSVAYTNAGLADATLPQSLFMNRNGSFPMSAIRAFGVFPLVASGLTTPAANYYNINPSVAVSGNTYTVTLTANATSSDNVALFVCVNPNTLTYTRLNSSFASNVLTVTYAFTNGNVSFAILQF